MIDAQGNILKDNPDYPEIESGIEFAIYRFLGKRSSFVSEYIFARQSFDSEGGFVDFPLAWCSDDASWISFSKNHGIYTIKGPRVLWRYSGLNISTAGNKYQKQKIDSAIKYLKWLDRQIARNKLVIKNKDDIKLLKKISREWLYNQLFFVAPLGITRYYKVLRLIHEIFDKSNFKDIFILFMVDFKFYMSMFKNIIIKNRPRFFL